MKQTNQADTFRCALAVFTRAMQHNNVPVTEDAIVRLAIACDYAVQFAIDESEMVTFIFTDGSRAIVAPATTH